VEDQEEMQDKFSMEAVEKSEMQQVGDNWLDKKE
jgi:hypothetical protein